jgi:hypothetical protein
VKKKDEAMKKRALILMALLVIAATAACTNDEGETEAPVFITIDFTLQPLIVNVGVPAPVQIQTIQLESHLKNPSASDPQGFADTQINAYTVRWRRADGGTLVPQSQTFGAAVLVPSGGTATLNNFPVMLGSQLQVSPFDQLLPFNGGVDRTTGRDEIYLQYDITFFGRTASGHRVQSETATADLIFRFLGF